MGRRGTASMGRVGRSRARRRCGSTVEQLICNQWVAGSIPVAGTTQFRKPPRHTASVACFFAKF